MANMYILWYNLCSGTQYSWYLEHCVDHNTGSGEKTDTRPLIHDKMIFTAIWSRFGFSHLHVVCVEDVIFDVVEGPEVETEDVGDGNEPNQQRAA